MQSERTGKNKKRIGKIVVALLLALAFAAIFALGFFVRWLTTPLSARRVEWIGNYVRSYYYQELTDEQISTAISNDTLFTKNGVEGLLDQYSAAYTEEEYNSLMNQYYGTNTGIGVSVYSYHSYCRIYRVMGNSPSENAGICEGMYIYGLGSPVTEMVEGDYSAIKQAFSDLTSQTRLYVEAGVSKESSRVYTVDKVTYQSNYVYYYDAEENLRFGGDDGLQPVRREAEYTFLPQDTAVIRLTSFDGQAATQMRSALEELKSKEKKKLVLDLRNDGGGGVNVLTGLAQYLCKDAPSDKFPVLVAKHRSGKETDYAEHSYYADYLSGVTVSVFCNKNSASASEALIGAMVDYNTLPLSRVYVEQVSGDTNPSTYGKGIMQTTYYNPFVKTGLKLTVATVHWPVSDTCIHDTGISTEMGATAVPCDDYLTYDTAALETLISNYVCNN